MKNRTYAACALIFLCFAGTLLGVLLDKHPHPTDEQMKTAFESLVCRCGSHARIFSAVRRASDAMKRSA